MPQPNQPRLNVFTSRSPCNRAEIETCVAMWEDSPYWDHRLYKLNRTDVVDAWEGLLINGQGYIDVMENRSYEKILVRTARPTRKNLAYDHRHKFHSIWFVSFLTKAFVREIIAKADISDIGLHFIQTLIAHRKGDGPSPVPSVAAIMRGHKHETDQMLCNFAFLVWHPELDAYSEKFLNDSAAYIDRVWDSAKRMHGGFAHHAWVTNVTGEIAMQAYANSGHKLLRPYPDNASKLNDAKKYIFCLTKNQAVSEELGIPKSVDAIATVGNTYRPYFDVRTPVANLKEEEQHAAYLIAVGYARPQIANAMHVSEASVTMYQHSACKKLRAAGYDFGDHNSREDLQEIIKENLHEVRSLIVPLYPWPQGLSLRK